LVEPFCRLVAWDSVEVCSGRLDRFEKMGLCDPACRVLLRRRVPVGFVFYCICGDEVDSTGSSTEDTRLNFEVYRT
jgi:hypothetical protein